MGSIFLGVGHGGNDPGAVGYIREADVNLKMALACRDYLIANGVEVKMSRTKDENDDLNEEIRECNAFNPDYAVDIHNNAGGGDGCEVFHSIFVGPGKTLAENINTELVAIGQNSRGCKTRKNSTGNADYYGFIRNTNAPAVIVEGVFVDNQADAAQADTLEEQKTFGVAIAKGILKTLGVININEPQAAKPVEQTTKSIIDLANEVIAGKYGIGEARKQALGSLYNEVQAKVNEILTGKALRPTKSVNEIVDEVIAGKWGVGEERKTLLRNAGYNYETIQSAVNSKLKVSKNVKSVEQLAKEVIDGKWGNGADRKNRLTKAGYNYNEVQKRVNELCK